MWIIKTGQIERILIAVCCIYAPLCGKVKGVGPHRAAGDPRPRRRRYRVRIPNRCSIVV